MNTSGSDRSQIPSSRESKSRTNKTEENSSELTCFVKLAAKQLSSLHSHLTVNYRISLQLLSLHIFQCVTSLLTGTWWLLIKKAWEIHLNNRLSMQHAGFSQGQLYNNKHRQKYVLQQQGKTPHTHSKPTCSGKLCLGSFSVFLWGLWGFLIGFLFVWLGCVGVFLEFFLSHLQVNRPEDQSLLMPLNYDPELLVLPKHKKLSSGQRISPWAWCSCSLCAPQLYMKQPANLHPVTSDGSRTCQRVPKLLGVRDFTHHIRSLLTG